MTDDRREMFVSSLFAELEFLQVKQKDVAAYFGVSEAMVSQWATGGRPMSMRRADAFLAFVQEQQERALERARAEPRPAPRASIIGGPIPTPEEKLDRKIGEFWLRWHNELDETNGEIYQDLVEPLQVLRRYGELDRHKLREALNAAPDARQTRTAVLTAAKAVVREMNRLERIRPSAAGADHAE